MILPSRPIEPRAFPSEAWSGMTMREYYASLAMSGILAGIDNFIGDVPIPEAIAIEAFRLADAMINEGKK